jgi:hypothetical protein
MGPSIGCALEVFLGLLQVRQECNGRIPAQGRLAGEALPSIDSPNSRDLSFHLGTTASIRLGWDQAALSVVGQ